MFPLFIKAELVQNISAWFVAESYNIGYLWVTCISAWLDGPVVAQLTVVFEKSMIQRLYIVRTWLRPCSTKHIEIVRWNTDRVIR